MKKLYKVLALALTLAMIIGATLVTGVVSTTAETTDVTVWEGTIEMDFTTKNTVAIINSDDSLTQAIRDDIAANGSAVKYTLTSADSSFVSGPSGYTTWGFYDEMTAATSDNYCEVWADKGSTMNSATWTDSATLALLGLKCNLCLYSDDTGDMAHVGSIKLVATHDGNAVPVTTKAPTPSVDPSQIEKTVLWTGEFNEDFTTSNTMAMLKNDEMNDAIRNDIAANGTASAYVVEATGSYVSGSSGYASFIFYQETPTYLEAWADKGSGVNLAVWSDASLLSQMGNKVQLALGCDTDGDVIHIDTLTIYVSRENMPSQATSATAASETAASETAASETAASETAASETDPSTAEVVAGDANGDGTINMKDVLALRKFLADMPAGELNMANADVNGDGSVNMKDVLALRKELAK